MRKIFASGGLAAMLVFSQAGPALAHSTEAAVNEDGVVANVSSHDYVDDEDDDDGLLEDILGDFDDEGDNDDDGLLDVIVGDFDDEDDDDDSLLDVIVGDFGDEDDDYGYEDNDSLLGIL